MFHVGMLVVCVQKFAPDVPPPFPIVGNIYRISEAFMTDTTRGEQLQLQFEELRSEEDDIWVAGFDSAGFRPLDNNRIAIFKQMLVKPPKKELVEVAYSVERRR